ncbi:MAG: hypothetical protein AAFO04_08410 [Cyanobacteria bacterium J06592_8]
MEKKTYIELFWDCPECGQQAISAIKGQSHDGYTCPQCGYNRKRSDRLYERPESRTITDPDLIRRIETGKVDWECKYCGSLNPQTGVGEEMMACRVCGQFQTDDFSPETPETATVGEQIHQRTEPIRDRFEVIPKNLERFTHSSRQTSQRNGATSSSRKSLVRGLSIAGAVAGSAVGGWWLLSSHPVEVQVQSLPWEVQVEVQQLKPVNTSGWDETLPIGARIRSSQTRQRGTRQVQRGSRTIWVNERYQSGSRIETYSDQVRYQSGSRTECQTTSTGTGAGQRTCRDVPVYSTRPVQRSREVPVYSTRQVPRVVPNMVTEPVYDQYVYYTVDKWVYEQTFTKKGFDDQPRTPPVVRLDNSPYPERALSPETSCQITGVYQQGDQQNVKTWKIDCNQFDLIDTGDRVTLDINQGSMVTLKEVLSK